MLNGVADSRESRSLSELSHPTHNIMYYKINVTYTTVLLDYYTQTEHYQQTACLTHFIRFLMLCSHNSDTANSFVTYSM